MSETQNSLPESRAEPNSLDSAMSGLSGQLAAVDCDPCNEFGIEKGGEVTAHKLLSPPTTAQGRRSLFRR